MNTLKTLVDNLNETLSNIEGSPVSGLLDGLKMVRSEIKENEFYKGLIQNGLQNVLVFKDNIEDSSFVFLRPSDDDELKKIIKINLQISFYDDGNPAKGGVIEKAECCLIEAGEKVANIPLEQVFIILKLASTNNKYKSLSGEIENIEAELKAKKEQQATYLAMILDLKKELGVIQ